MATNPKIRYDIEAAVSGGQDVSALARELEGLANTLEGDLKAQALASATALRELGAKQGAIDNFVKLKTEAGDAADRLEEAQQAAQRLGRELASSGAPTRAQAGQLEKLRDAVRTAKTELQGKTAALDNSRAALDRYGIGTANLAQSERNVRAAIAGARAEVVGMAPAYNAAASAATASGQRQAQAASNVRGELGRLSDQLSTLRNIAGAALGGTLVGSLAQDLGDVADSYANVAARVRLATDSNEGFEQGMADVQRIAQDTNTELQATAGLYTTLTRTSKDAGLSAKAAQEEAASLTEVINQSIQLSGASSQAAQAAVTQLIQGLQSGVLRGEEFNSVVEQSPRLARALADGLGVTIGQLREMANQGQLTADVIRKALGGQAQAIQQEFDKLPPTIGRAVQSLSNAWTVYVGETDKATGASRTAAEAIALLARNLDTIAGLLIDVGQAAAAFAALRLAQSFLGIGAAANTAAAGIGAATVALGSAGASAAATGAAVAATAGRIAAVLRTLRTFTLVGLLVNIKDIGEWLGETAAKLMGYKVATDQMADAERNLGQVVQERMERQRALQAEQALAIERSKGLTLEVKALASEYEQLKKQGVDTGDALRKVAESASLLTAVDTRQFGVFLRSVGADFQATADAFQAALKGADLADFERRARAAFGGAKEDAALLEAALNAGLREAVRQSGADFDVLAGGMSEASRKAISATGAIISGLERLSDQGVDTAAALTASLGKAINTADSQAAFEALRSQVEEVRKVLGDQVADTFLQQIEDKARAAATEVGGLGDALRQLGITSDADLTRAADAARRLYEQVRQAGGSAREQGEAFRKMAEAAIASGDDTALAFARAQAAVQGFELVTDSAGRTAVRSMNEARQAVDTYRGSMQGATEDIQEYVGWLDRMAKRNAEVRSSIKTDADGFALDKGGNRLSAGGDLTTLTGISNFLKSAGLDEEQAKRVALEFSDGKGNIPYFSNPGQVKYGGRASTISEALLKAAERTTFGSGAGVGGAVGRTVNVNLSVGGERATVRTDEEGAQALVTTLQRAGLSARG